MLAFKKDEIYTATEVVRNFSSVLNKISSGDTKRAVVVKNNKFEAVILNMDEYERLEKAVEILESIYNSSKKDK
ncbi:type II toxin-antitoxin system Phd/YefM family antitoxin [Campylobacter pinnipediorum]|uniref:Antitoxin n=2 Tax=Campylobacter pinnipediorum TaxID=1965231 RepID=A0A1S6U6T4_9BACT|nr:type II toxin-antitoxin system Phd/YefM family antitoxin [Campylobacter pinnipediorum]AQW80912.1 putative toxin-antitoxin system, antitoxin component, Phd/YefM family [Campylobacter pinnipediorum subsp. pinnipediorum]AQW82530.1 putative toxin-antitoxin system, antitoxin component, Phd/YefM family [Campylobacter pinnipediorum subsp. pinnipediorum]AQW84215.1 putative toxin-antitoxin system, antitoxin component, Phd/YefM family [Campylobacter pinnipediorum subsp. pinnipediorum]AQW85840.1 putati